MSGLAVNQALWSPSARFLLAVAVVVAVAQLLGALVRRIGQPFVVGEILAGLLLGPSVLGVVVPELQGWVFSGDVLAGFEMVSQLGLVAFMLVLGMEARIDRSLGKVAAPVALAGFLLPFGCAVPVAILLYEAHSAGASMPGFALFFGLALSITALPVLARILQERKQLTTQIGGLAITAAGLGDLAAWITLAFVLAITGSANLLDGLWTLGTAGVYLVAMLAARPALRALTRACADGRIRETTLLSVVVVGGILSALATEAVGVHAVLGALLFGVLLPRDSAVVRRARERIEGVTVAVLLPIFFAYVGLHTSVGVLGSPHGWLIWLGILVLAMGTKVVGVYVAARLRRVSRRESMTLGILMNCRGLTELVIADVGYRQGIIDGYLFTALVLVALVTTALTTPMLALSSRFRAERTAEVAAGVRSLERSGRPSM